MSVIIKSTERIIHFSMENNDLILLLKILEESINIHSSDPETDNKINLYNSFNSAIKDEIVIKEEDPFKMP